MKTEEELCDFLGKDLNKIEQLCRICLGNNLCNAILICKDLENNVKDLKSLEAKIMVDGELSLLEKFIVFGIDVKFEDELSKYICEQCYFDVDVAYTFRVKCHKAQNLLKKVLQIISIEQNDTCSQYMKCKTEFIEIPIVEEIKNVNIKKEYTLHSDDDHVNKDESELEEESEKEDGYEIKKQAEDVIASERMFKVTSGDSKEREATSGKNIRVTGESKNDEEKKHVCNICHKAWTTKTSLISHMNKMHREKKVKVGIVIGRGAERRIHCPECDFKCKRWQAFNYHMVTHTGLKAYKCDECGKSFTQHSSLYSHKKIHSDKMYFTCQECGKQFKRKYHLTIHHRVHSTELNYKCHICNKALKTQEVLDQHIKRHLNIKDFSCEICGKCFVTRSELITHSANHDKTAKFFCTMCSYSTNTKYNLKLHIQRHSGLRPHQCDQCDYAGVTTSELQSHLIKHSKESKFSCPICDKKFRHKSDLNRHIDRKHEELKNDLLKDSKEPMFICSICDKKFCHRNGLCKHMENKHGEVQQI